MSLIAAYRTAKVLADLGHADTPLIPHADMDMAARLADAPLPQTPTDRAAICDALDDLPTSQPGRNPS